VTASLSNSPTGSVPPSGTAVVHKRRVVQLILEPRTTALLTGETQQFATRGVRNSGDTISVSANYAATGGTITSSGLYTAGATPGNFMIIATRRALADTALVAITTPSTAPVATVTVAPATKTLRIGTSVQLTATTKDSTGALLVGRSITWSSDAPAVATVSADRLVSAVAVGSATITATSEGKSGTASITVTVVPVASVTVTPSPGSVSIGSTLQLTAVTKDSAGKVLTVVSSPGRAARPGLGRSRRRSRFRHCGRIDDNHRYERRQERHILRYRDRSIGGAGRQVHLGDG